MGELKVGDGIVSIPATFDADTFGEGTQLFTGHRDEGAKGGGSEEIFFGCRVHCGLSGGHWFD